MGRAARERHRAARRDVAVGLRSAAPSLDSDGWRRGIAVNDGPMNLVGRSHIALRTPAEYVYEDDPDVRLLVTRMHATINGRPIPSKPGYRTPHRGLALTAAQVGLPFSIVALLDGRTFFNVSVTDVGGADRETALEGCLSIPGRWYAVERARRVNVVARPLGGREACKLTVVDLDARMWAHEADHLAGRLISEHWPEVSPLGDTALPTGAEARLAKNAETGALLS